MFFKTNNQKNTDSDNASSIDNIQIDENIAVGSYIKKTEVYDYDENGNKEVKIDENGEKVYSSEELILRSDGNFYLSINNYYANTPSVGTFSIENNKLTLREIVTYGSDTCFFTKNLNVYDGAINSNSISLNINGEKYIFEKVNNSPRVDTYYVTTPIDGVVPLGHEDAWKDCTN